MTLNFVNQYPAIKNWLVNNVGYYSKQLYIFNDEELVYSPEVNTKVIIIAKCHYSESWQTFSSISKKDLEKILTLKKATESKIGLLFQSYRNEAIDGYEVKTIKINSSIIEILGKDRVYIPETELFNPYQENQLLKIETIAGSMFCSQVDNKIRTSYAKGIVNNIDTYKLSVGLPLNIEVLNIQVKDFSKFLLTQLLKLNFSQFGRVSTFDIKAWFNSSHLHLLYWAPILSSLFFYLTFTGYLYLKGSEIESELLTDSQQVSRLINNKNKIDEYNKILAALSLEFKNSNQYVHYHWLLIDELLDMDMNIIRINYSEGILSIRGLADKASSVLLAISKHPKVKSATFKGEVRKSQGLDLFEINLEVRNNDAN
ncbi:hypothetical protein [Thalassotalea sp. SU-HH00458]|uniref:hypothetical protein n=1 Tax=Thalassotalea sp. SU-HH00458 TaxID=3127657 RepID=UPI003104A2E5